MNAHQPPAPDFDTTFHFTNEPLDDAEALERRLRAIGAARYHDRHPFHHLLHDGKLNLGQVQAWALNRCYYQSSIPIKDALVISRFRDRALRREWRHRHLILLRKFLLVLPSSQHSTTEKCAMLRRRIVSKRE